MTNRNYNVMEIQTEYQDRLMKSKVPELYWNYLSTWKCNNKSGKPYSAEPLDERHKEYSKNVKSLEDFILKYVALI